MALKTPVSIYSTTTHTVNKTNLKENLCVLNAGPEPLKTRLQITSQTTVLSSFSRILQCIMLSKNIQLTCSEYCTLQPFVIRECEKSSSVQHLILYSCFRQPLPLCHNHLCILCLACWFLPGSCSNRTKQREKGQLLPAARSSH